MKKIIITTILTVFSICCFAQRGSATYYANKFNGRRTANGEIYNPNKLTAASNTLDFGTKVKVTNLSNCKTVIVTINDRMAKNNKRLLDLSKDAAIKLGFFGEGITKVEIKIINE